MDTVSCVDLDAEGVKDADVPLLHAHQGQPQVVHLRAAEPHLGSEVVNSGALWSYGHWRESEGHEARVNNIYEVNIYSLQYLPYIYLREQLPLTRFLPSTSVHFSLSDQRISPDGLR